MLFTLSSSSVCLVTEEMQVFTRELIIYTSECADFGQEGKKMHPNSHKRARNCGAGLAVSKSLHSRQ